MANIVVQLTKARAASRVVRQQTGKSLLRQSVEIAGARRLGLSPGDYYRYRLFDDTRFAPGQKREYTGVRFQNAVYPYVNDPGLIARTGLSRGWGGAVDKLLFDSLMQRAGVPTPRILAVFDTTGIEYGEVETCRTRDELRQVIQARGSGFFLKPARAHTGHGARAVERIEAESVVLADGSCVTLDALLDHACSYDRVLLQERLAPHPDLCSAVGSTLATVRVSVLRRPLASTIHRTVLRIPTGTNMVDNFDGGNTGNLVASVDVSTGEVLRVYSGTGVTQVRVPRHPDTGATLEGLVLPEWTEACALVERASRLLSAVQFQSWDLALTDRGPVMVEINDVSSQDVLQLAGPPGMLDAELCSFLRELGFRWRYPHAPGVSETS